MISHGQIARMVSKARERSGEIGFCGLAKSWAECIRVYEGVAFLHYNDTTGGTHVITEPAEYGDAMDKYADPPSRYERQQDKDADERRRV